MDAGTKRVVVPKRAASRHSQARAKTMRLKGYENRMGSWNRKSTITSLSFFREKEREQSLASNHACVCVKIIIAHSSSSQWFTIHPPLIYLFIISRSLVPKGVKLPWRGIYSSKWGGSHCFPTFVRDDDNDDAASHGSIMHTQLPLGCIGCPINERNFRLIGINWFHSDTGLWITMAGL